MGKHGPYLPTYLPPSLPSFLPPSASTFACPVPSSTTHCTSQKGSREGAWQRRPLHHWEGLGGREGGREGGRDQRREGGKERGEVQFWCHGVQERSPSNAFPSSPSLPPSLPPYLRHPRHRSINAGDLKQITTALNRDKPKNAVFCCARSWRRAKGREGGRKGGRATEGRREG